MPSSSSLAALKRYLTGAPPPKDIELPMPKGGKRDPRLPKESAILQGLRVARDLTRSKEKK